MSTRVSTGNQNKPMNSLPDEQEELKTKIFQLVSNQDDQQILGDIFNVINQLVYNKNIASQELKNKEARSYNDTSLAIEKRRAWALEWLVG